MDDRMTASVLVVTVRDSFIVYAARAYSPKNLMAALR